MKAESPVLNAIANLGAQLLIKDGTAANAPTLTPSSLNMVFPACIYGRGKGVSGSTGGIIVFCN